jgi:ABC-2 type transport system permease protein
MNAFPALIRREFWEHRALWIVPLICSGILLLIAFSGRGFVHLPKELAGAVLTHEQRVGLFAMAQWGLASVQYFAMSIVLFFYLIECLYAERRDRSILFWKSLPVSDAATVLSKLLVASLIVPLGVYVLALVTDVVFTGIFRMSASGSPTAQALFAWDTEVWLRVQGLMLIGLFAAVLWYAPIAGYLMLMSAWARRNVFLWAVLPPVLLLIIEEIAFDTDYVKALLAHRLAGPWQNMGVTGGMDRIENALEGDDKTPPVAELLASIDAWPVFASPGLWIGVAVAAALIWSAVRIRRYRDDT